MKEENLQGQSQSSVRNAANPNLLVVNLGLGADRWGPLGYAATTYLMPDGARYPTPLGFVALWKWLEATGRPLTAVVFACTKEAWEKRHDAVRKHVAELGLNPDTIEKPIFLVLPERVQDVWDMVAPLENWVVKHGTLATPVLHIDLTHAFRAIPLAHLLIVLYLQERGLIHVGVCGYGAFQEGKQETTPYLDLSHLFHLARWAQAVRAFRERFDTAGLAALLEHYEKEARHEIAQAGSIPPPEVRRVVNAARQAGPYFAAGLPLELGMEVRETLGDTTRENLKKTAEQLFPAHRNLLLDLFDFLKPLAPAHVAKSEPKAHMVLNAGELKRQIRVVHLLIQAGLPERALLVMRETVINRLLLACCPEKWLERSVREAAEALLNNVLRQEPPPITVTDELAKVRSIWNKIANLRNPLAHAGMQKENVNLDRLTSKVTELVATLEVDEPWLQLARHGKHLCEGLP